jgi:hypothetical protein
MKKSHLEVKNKIDAEVEKIMVDEPEEIKKLRYGIVESEAGSFGQYFSTLVFLDGETRDLGIYCLYGLLRAADDPSFDLEHLKKLFDIYVLIGAEFIGYCGITKMWEFTKDVKESFPSLKKKEDFIEVVSSLTKYAFRIQGWVHHYVPWGIGSCFPRRSKDDVREMFKLTGGD